MKDIKQLNMFVELSGSRSFWHRYWSLSTHSQKVTQTDRAEDTFYAKYWREVLSAL